MVVRGRIREVWRFGMLLSLVDHLEGRRGPRIHLLVMGYGGDLGQLLLVIYTSRVVSSRQCFSLY